MIPMRSIIDYERGPIWDFVSDQTGLSDYDLLQLQNVIHQNILKYVGDHNYLLFKAQSRRIANKIQPVISIHIMGQSESMQGINIPT